MIKQLSRKLYAEYNPLASLNPDLPRNKLRNLVLASLNRTVLSVQDKGKYEIRTEMVSVPIAGADKPVKLNSCYTKNGDYIGDEKTAQFLIDEMGIMPELASPEHSVCSIGFCKKDNKWAGWSHRAIVLFGIGDKIFEQDYGNDHTLFVKHGTKTITTLAEAKQSAINFAEYVS